MCVWILFRNRMLAVVPVVSDFFFFLLSFWLINFSALTCGIKQVTLFFVTTNAFLKTQWSAHSRRNIHEPHSWGPLQQVPLFFSARKPHIDLVMFVSVANAGTSLWYWEITSLQILINKTVESKTKTVVGLRDIQPMSAWCAELQQNGNSSSVDRNVSNCLANIACMWLSWCSHSSENSYYYYC